jgi:putative membrane protein
VKKLARVLAVAGLLLAAVLFARENVGHIAATVARAAPGLLVASAFHLLPMVLNAIAWDYLFPAGRRPGVRALTFAVWIRESVNGVLPVARIGGEVVAYRILRRIASSRAEAAASLAADVALSVVSQSAFALLGLSLLLAGRSTSGFVAELIAATLVMLVLGGAFVYVQRAGALAALTRVAERLFARPFHTAMRKSRRVDRTLRDIYQRRRDIVACIAWQLAGWMAGAGEISLALHFLGAPSSLLDALVIEALIQAISSAAFIVPGALGVQEAGFIVLGAALGLDPPTSLALAAARRLRDVVIFVPGLAAWQWFEARTPRVRNARESA